MKKHLLTLLLFVPVALAHEVEKDGDVGGLIHIEPTDNPVVGNNVARFEINQKGGIPINMQNCTCVLNIYAGAYKAGAKPQSTVKLLTDKKHLKGTLHLPEAGPYTLVLTGKPRAGATFKAFTLQWAIRTGGASDGHDHDH